VNSIGAARNGFDREVDASLGLQAALIAAALSIARIVKPREAYSLGSQIVRHTFSALFR